jgi:hypothetical protein
MNCSYCYLTLEETDESCPRCGLTVEVATSPSGGEAAQAAAPTSYQPGGPTGDIGIHATCPGCGDSMGSSGHEKASPSCPTCGFAGVEHDEGWSDFVTLNDAQNAAIWISHATLAEADDEIIRRLATGIVWGDFPDMPVDETDDEEDPEGEEAFAAYDNDDEGDTASDDQTDQ